MALTTAFAFGLLPLPLMGAGVFSVVDMLDRTHIRARLPAMTLLEWHRWFAWHPVPHRESRKIALCLAAIYRTKVGYQQIQRHNEWRYRLRSHSRSR
jgi:hypothetical protein